MIGQESTTNQLTSLASTKSDKFCDGGFYDNNCPVFLDSRKLEIVWIKITTFFKRSVSNII